jgi:hypothetical protein
MEMERTKEKTFCWYVILLMRDMLQGFVVILLKCGAHLGLWTACMRAMQGQEIWQG